MRYRGQFGHSDEFWPGRRFLVILETPRQLHQGFYLHQDFPCIKVRPLIYGPSIRGPVMLCRDDLLHDARHFAGEVLQELVERRNVR